MRQLPHRAPDATALYGAAQLAAARPEERLPCPACATSVKGANLAGHLQKVHGGTSNGPPTASTTIEGLDRRIRRWYPMLALAWLAAMGAVTLLGSDPLADSPGRTPGDFSASTWKATLGDLATAPIGIIFLGGLVAAVALVVADRAGVARARVTVDEDGVHLRHRLGTGRVAAPFPAEVELGSLFRIAGGSRGDGSGQGGPSVEVTEGAYLRVRHARRSITIGCTHGTDVRKHWTGWQAGPRSKRWDVTVDPASFVALQYALARTGALLPR